MIRGLSLSRPWPDAFRLGKRIENRTWRPPASMQGQWLALHASKSWSDDDRAWILETTGQWVPTKADCPHSVIFAVCKLRGCVESADDPRVFATQRKWFFGPVAWLLDSFIFLQTPVSCAGALGLWKIDDKPEVLDALREQLNRQGWKPFVDRMVGA